MRLVTAPNWSFAREKSLMTRFREILAHPAVTLHYCESDIDLNRTVTAFSAEDAVLVDMVVRLALAAFDVIDLTRHVGAHPRIGALDVCPIVIPTGRRTPTPSELMNALVAAENLASQLAAAFHLPLFLYEKSERGRHEADLPSLRKGGFGGLVERALRPDFGPAEAHPRLGVSIVGVRDFLISCNVNLSHENPDVAEDIAGQIRVLRTEGDPRMLGVRARGFPLASRHQSQINLNLTLPDLTPVDPIIEWVYGEANRQGVAVANAELVGVIRDLDVPLASRLPIRPSQIVSTA